MKKLLGIIILGLLLTACASEQKYFDTLNTWIGAPEEKLVSSWGVPQGFYEKQNGEKLLQYDWDAIVTLQGDTYKTWCKTTFTISEGKVKSWETEGNECTAN